MFRPLERKENFTFADGPVRVEHFNKTEGNRTVQGMICIDSEGTRLLRIHSIDYKSVDLPALVYTEEGARRVLFSNSRKAA